MTALYAVLGAECFTAALTGVLLAARVIRITISTPPHRRADR